jgi:hypothetical protein
MRPLLIGLLSSLLVGQQLPPQLAQDPDDPQQQPTGPRAKCAVEGKVVNAVTGEPLRKAVLVLRRNENRNRSEFSGESDAEGRFALKDVSLGRYTLWAERAGYVSMQYGARGAGRSGTTMSLDAGQRVKDVLFRLTPQSVIAGRVVDEDGEPVPYVQVQAMRYGYHEGRKQLMPADSAQTNDLGEYRLFGLAAGKYYLSATHGGSRIAWSTQTPGNEPETGYAPTYYPGSNDPSTAAPIELGAGVIVRGVDIPLVRTRTVRVRGTLTNAVSNRPPRRAMLMLLPRDSQFGFPLTGGNMTQLDDPKGRFELRGVAPGAYTLVANVWEDEKHYSARTQVDVGNVNVEGVNFTISEGAEIPGSIKVEGNSGANLGDVRIFLEARAFMPFGGGASASPKEDGNFRLANVSPDKYRVRLYGLPEDFYLKGIRMGDEDVLENGLDLSSAAAGSIQILLSPQGGQIEGVVHGSNQQPVAGATVVLVPESRKRSQDHLYAQGTTDQYGRFRLRGIAPGDYKLFAWEDVEPGEWQDPDFLKRFESRGESFSINENGHENAQLKLIASQDPGGTAPSR